MIGTGFWGFGRRGGHDRGGCRQHSGRGGKPSRQAGWALRGCPGAAAAAEAAIGLAIIVVYYRNSGTIRVEEIDKLKG